MADRDRDQKSASGVKANKTGSARADYNRASALARVATDAWNQTTGQDARHLADVLRIDPDAGNHLAEVPATSDEYEFSLSMLRRRLEHFRIENDEVIPAAWSALERGNLVALGISTEKRFKSLPDVPTFAELGLPQANVMGWKGVAAHPDLPDEIVKIWEAAIQKTIESGKVLTFEATIHRDETEPIDLAATTRRVRLAGDALLLTAFHEITRHKDEQRIFKTFHRQLVEDLPIEVVVMAPQGQYLYVNPKAIPDKDLREFLIGETDVEYCQEMGYHPEVALRRRSHRRCFGCQTTAGRHDRFFCLSLCLRFCCFGFFHHLVHRPTPRTDVRGAVRPRHGGGPPRPRRAQGPQESERWQ